MLQGIHLLFELHHFILNLLSLLIVTCFNFMIFFKNQLLFNHSDFFIDFVQLRLQLTHIIIKFIMNLYTNHTILLDLFIYYHMWPKDRISPFLITRSLIVSTFQLNLNGHVMKFPFTWLKDRINQSLWPRPYIELEQSCDWPDNISQQKNRINT